MSTRLLALFLCFLTFAPIANADSKSNAIKLGAILALTGDMAPQNNAFLESIELGLKEINDKGGIRSSTVKLTVEDSSLIPKNSNTAARKLYCRGASSRSTWCF